MFNCATGKWPIKYLGVPVAGSKLHVVDWRKLDEKIMKGLDGWKGNILSIGGRTTLINPRLSSIPVYAMSMYLIPKTVVKSMDRTRKRFFWQEGGTKKKYHLIKWDKICVPKKKGGLGIKDLRKLNLSLLCKWWWKLERGEGMWQEIVRKKYVKSLCLQQLQKKPSKSSVWNDLLKAKDLYLKRETHGSGGRQSY
jgi:hypothetical protein